MMTVHVIPEVLEPGQVGSFYYLKILASGVDHPEGDLAFDALRTLVDACVIAQNDEVDEVAGNLTHWVWAEDLDVALNLLRRRGVEVVR